MRLLSVGKLHAGWLPAEWLSLAIQSLSLSLTQGLCYPGIKQRHRRTSHRLPGGQPRAVLPDPAVPAPDTHPA